MSFPTAKQLAQEAQNPQPEPKRLTQTQQKYALKRIDEIEKRKLSALEDNGRFVRQADAARSAAVNYLKANPQFVQEALERLFQSGQRIVSHYSPWSGTIELKLETPDFVQYMTKRGEAFEEDCKVLQDQLEAARARVRKEAGDLRDAIVFIGAPEVLALIQQFDETPVSAIANVAA